MSIGVQRAEKYAILALLALDSTTACKTIFEMDLVSHYWTFLKFQVGHSQDLFASGSISENGTRSDKDATSVRFRKCPVV